MDASEEILNKLERLQNISIRFIFDLKKFDHVSNYRKQLKWLPIRHRRSSRILCFLFNVIHNPDFPQYLRDRFSFVHSNDTLCRAQKRTLLLMKPHKTDFFSYSFSVHAVRLWNSLPYKIRESESLPIFKKRVKDYFISLT